MIVRTCNPTELAKEIFWLAWQACGGPLGMGVLQNCPLATRDDVWNNINCHGDYPLNNAEPSRPYADYVFGRMMKFGLQIHPDRLEIRTDFAPTPDYEAWCGVYPTYEALVQAAIESLGISAETLSAAPG